MSVEAKVKSKMIKSEVISSKQKGDKAEAKARFYLEKLGFEIIDFNFYAKKLGEIDIIAKKNNTYHFIEVKSGVNFEPSQNLSPKKMKKILKSVDFYLQSKSIENAFCIDALLIKNEEITFLENISI